MIDSLIARYVKLEAPEKLNYEEVSLKLNITFSKDFKDIGDRVRFDYILGVGGFSFDIGVLQKTLKLRENVNLPKDTLVLLENDASLIFMKCFGDHEEVYWISMEDAYRYCDGDPFMYNPITFPTFADFFSYLLDEEEKERAEDQ